MFRKTLICLAGTLLLLAGNSIFGQNPVMNWYFGQNVGISFLSGSPQNLIGSQMNTWEGCASVSDSLGNLLFYTDGVTVWAKNHSVMSNGSGLWGSTSCTQSCLIVPMPSSNSKYYIFTTTSPSTQWNQPGRLAWSLVDMSLASGFGSVTSKNNLLFQGNTSEKLAGVQHGLDCDAWVVTCIAGTQNAYYAYKVTAAGVSANPVISAVGMSQSMGQGTLRISPDGSRLANVVRYATAGSVEICDFNDSTGVVSNCITIPDQLAEYGAEFSPDGSKLYACLMPQYNSTFPNGWGLFQFNLNLGTPAAVIASMTYIGPVSGFPGTMQLGTDRKLYIAKNYNNHLGVVQYPDALGTVCSYVDMGFTLSSMSTLGLPNLLSSYFIPEPTFVYQDTCYLDSTMFSFYGDVDFYYWDFGDYGSGVNNYANIKNPKHIYSAPGFYTARLVSVHNCRFDTVTLSFEIVKPDIDLGPDTSTCDGGSITLDAGPGHVYQLWEDLSYQQLHTASDSGWYWCEVMDGHNCVYRDSLLFSYFPSPVVNLGSDTSICQGDSAHIDAGDFSSWQWNTGFSGKDFWTSTAGDYSVSITDSNTCSASDTMSLFIKPTPFLDLPSVELLCSFQTYELDAGPGYDSYLWDDGSTSSIRMVYDTGMVKLTVWVEGCDASDSMYFEPCSQLYVPSAFTPDGDGLNDEFNAKGIEIRAYRMEIFNRLGQLVFITEDLNTGWDGRVQGEDAPAGTYVYFIESTNRQDEVFVKRGTLQLLR